MLEWRKLSRGRLIDRRKFLATMVTIAIVLFLASPCNSLRPTITSLDAEAEWIAPFGGLLVTCTASSSDGGQLSYQWSASGGIITGTGSEVVWTAPDTDVNTTVTVTAEVFDGTGNWARESVIFEVLYCPSCENW